MRRLMATLFLAVAALSLSVAPATAADGLKAGEDYKLITPPLPTEGNGKVEVVELFWYGCPHCYQFEPMLEGWLENKPANVDFIRIPAIFNNPAWKVHAQAFYTAEVLGVLDKFHKPFFDAIHKQRERLRDRASIRKFFERIDVDGKTFDETFDSFAVQAKVRRAADLTRKYGIDGVPSIVVNGKYRTDGPMAGSYERLLQIVNELIARESSVKAD